MKVDVARFPSTGTSDDEPARAFLQSRIGLWAFWIFALSFGFYLVNVLTWPFVREGRLADMLFETANVDHLIASLTFGVVALAARRLRLSIRALRVLDVATLL